MMTKALIVYASLTGNTKEIAEITAKELEKQKVKTTVLECTQSSPDDFLLVDLCVVATYTWGREGDLPDEMYPFYEELAEIDLTGKIYGVLGSGEESYGFYCKSVDDFDRQFQKTKATKGAENVKIELNPNEQDVKKIKKFTGDLIKTFQNEALSPI